MKITKQELKQLIKEEVDFLLREARFELGSPELGGATGTGLARTGGGGAWLHPRVPGTPEYTELQVARAQGIEPPLDKWRLERYRDDPSGWFKVWGRPTSKPGGAPIQHPGLATQRLDPITGQKTGGLDIEPPADPYEDPADFPLPTERPVSKRDDLSSLEAAIMQALMQRLG